MMARRKWAQALAAMRQPDPELLREAMGHADILLESVLHCANAPPRAFC